MEDLIRYQLSKMDFDDEESGDSYNMPEEDEEMGGGSGDEDDLGEESFGDYNDYN